MQTSLRIVTNGQAASMSSAEGRAVTHDSRTAAGLIGEIGSAITLLTRQCEDHERTLAATRQQAETDVAAAKQQAEDLRKFALNLRVKLNRLAMELPKLEQRAAAAERRVETTRTLAETAARAAAETEAVAALFPALQRDATPTGAHGQPGGLGERLTAVVTWMESLRDLSLASGDASGEARAVSDAA